MNDDSKVRFGLFVTVLESPFSAGRDRAHPLVVIVIDAEVEVAIEVDGIGIDAAHHRDTDTDPRDGSATSVMIVPSLE